MSRPRRSVPGRRPPPVVCPVPSRNLGSRREISTAVSLDGGSGRALRCSYRVGGNPGAGRTGREAGSDAGSGTGFRVRSREGRETPRGTRLRPRLSRGSSFSRPSSSCRPSSSPRRRRRRSVPLAGDPLSGVPLRCSLSGRSSSSDERRGRPASMGAPAASGIGGRTVVAKSPFEARKLGSVFVLQVRRRRVACPLSPGKPGGGGRRDRGNPEDPNALPPGSMPSGRLVGGSPAETGTGASATRPHRWNVGQSGNGRADTAGAERKRSANATGAPERKRDGGSEGRRRAGGNVGDSTS